MSPPQHREKDAKAEGRGPPEPAKKTMAPFRSLMGRLLKVPMSEVTIQQRLYEDEKHEAKRLAIPKIRRKKLVATPKASREQVIQRDKQDAK